ncbi:MAG: amino acid ABC transporter permease [Actinobacteria bacterium]|nr:amino acid ABC transporter permease [Actinomycetota bacterium]
MAGPMIDDAPKEPVVADETPLLPVPPRRLGTWAKENLFGSVKDTILTIVFGAILGWFTWKAITYAFFNARWEVIFDGPLHVYMVGGRFGDTGLEFANVWGAIFLVAAAGGWVGGLSVRAGAVPNWKRSLKIAAPALLGVGAVLAMTRTITPTLLVLATFAIGYATRWVVPRLPHGVARRSGWILTVLTVASFLVLTGGDPGNINRFGGLLLTVVVSAGGIVLSFPIGVVMALARRSSFPLIRPIAVGYIELIRGVPLITLLFMGQFALGFLFPPGMNAPGPIPRAIIVITLFTAAYVAEVVRGGLQSVPKGQTEAGQAVGLSPLKITRLIVLPQALRNSIPALIGQFISLLKDTSLLVVIGIQDLLGITEVVLGQLQFRSQGYQPETFAFVGLIYWVITFTMSRASQRLETRLGVGTR